MSGGASVAAHSHHQGRREAPGRGAAARVARARHCTHGPHRVAASRPGLACPGGYSRAATGYPSRGKS